MALWNQFPFTDFHGENIDWVFDKLKNLDDRVDTLEAGGGGATKQYVDEQDGKLSSEIARVEKECDTNTNNISRDLNTESENRQSADTLLEGEIRSISSTVTSINNELGDWTQQGTISNAIAGVQATAGNSATAIHGTGGTYDLSKGTIQARLNELEQGGGAPIVTTDDLQTLVLLHALKLPSSTQYNISANSDTDIETFSFNTSSLLPLDRLLYCINLKSTQGIAPYIAFSIIVRNISASSIVCTLKAYNHANEQASFYGGDLSCCIYEVKTSTVVTSVSGGGGSTSDVTKSYVDSQDAALDSKINEVRSTADSAVTLATEASDTATAAKNASDAATTTANNAKTAADTAATAADGATTLAQTANTNANKAIANIGSKPAAVTFSSLWAAIGAWAESATISARLKDAYNWSWNNRSAINGTADYPTDKGTINARLNELEENGGGSTQSYKLMSGTGEVGARTGEDLTVTFPTTFTSTPNVVAAYCKTGDNDTDISGIVKVHHVTTTGCVISITGGAVGHLYSVSWIATGE